MNMFYSKWRFSLYTDNVTFGFGWYWGEPWKLFSLEVLCDDDDGYLFTVFSITVLKFTVQLFVEREDK